MRGIFKRKIYIQTEYEDRHIEALEKERISYKLVSRIEAISWLGFVYFTWSVVIDTSALLLIIYYALFGDLPFFNKG